MDNQTKLTRDQVYELYDGFGHFFPENGAYVNSPFGRWANRTRFVEEIEQTTKINISTGNQGLIKKSQEIIEQLVDETKKDEPDVPDKWKLEQMKAEAEKRDADIKLTIENSKREIQNAINKQKELAEKIKARQIYIKTKLPKPSALSQREAEAIESLKKQRPDELANQLSKEIKERLSKNLPYGVTEAEVEFVSKRAALAAVQGLNGKSLAEEALILNKIATDKNIIADFDADTANSLRYSASRVANPKILEYVANRNVISSAFGETFADNVIGPNNLDIVGIEYSSVPFEGYKPYYLSEAPNQFSNFLNRESLLFNNISDLSYQSIKSQALRNLGVWIDRQVAKLPIESVTYKAFNNIAVKGFLNVFGVGEPLTWEATNLFGRIAIESGYGPTFGWIGKASGFNFGVSEASAGIAAENVGGGIVVGAAGGTSAAIFAASTAATAESVALTGGIMASEAFLGGAATAAAAGAAAGSAVPGPGTVIGAVGGFIVGLAGPKVVNFIKDNVYKIKDFAVMGGAAALGATIGAATGFGAMGGAILGGASGFGLSRLFTGGLPGMQSAAAGFGKGIFNAGWAIGATFMAGVGTPILVTLLVFPVVIALILFIINSGAYVVPPSLSSLNRNGFTSPYVDLKKTASPPGPFENSQLPEEITYTITIKPKKGSLNSVLLTYDCQVISKNATSCPSITLDDAHKDVFSQSISTLDPAGITFSYKSTYNSSFRDSAIIDSIKLSAISQDGNAVSAEVSADVQFGTPPVSCPVLGGHAATPTLNFSYNASQNTGHGSQRYWDTGIRRYSIPQSSGCMSPKECSFYGFAYDVFPTGSSDVYVPTVLGKDVTWNCAYWFKNGSVGHTYKCVGNGGDYLLVLTHMKNGAKTGTIKSGEKIGQLFPWGGNTHLHMEFQLNGRYVKPESYFCGGK